VSSPAAGAATLIVNTSGAIVKLKGKMLPEAKVDVPKCMQAVFAKYISPYVAVGLPNVAFATGVASILAFFKLL
jgi:hypothetical protein